MSKWQYMFGSDQVQSSNKFLYHENIFFRQNKTISSPSFKQSWALSGVYHRARLYTTVWWTRSSPRRRSPSSSPPLPRTTWQSSMTIRAIALVILSVLQLSTSYESITVVNQTADSMAAKTERMLRNIWEKCTKAEETNRMLSNLVGEGVWTNCVEDYSWTKAGRERWESRGEVGRRKVLTEEMENRVADSRVKVRNLWWTSSSPRRRKPSSSPPLPRTTWQPSMTIVAFALVLLTETQFLT